MVEVFGSRYEPVLYIGCHDAIEVGSLLKFSFLRWNELQSITLTPDHLLLVFEDENLKTKAAY